MRNNQWPTREEWAEHQRAVYYDRFEDLDFDASLSAHASPTNVETLIFALQELWKAEGARMKLAAKAAGPLNQQPVETNTAHFQRWFGMTPEEQEIVSPVSESRCHRSNIKKAIKRLQNNRLPHSSDDLDWLLKDASVAKVLGPIHASYVAAREAAEEKRKQEILATPIDDVAWEKELQRRASIERGWSDNSSFIH